jgi:hypothetical protein
VIGWMSALGYFRDPDGWPLDYLAMLDEPRLAALDVVPWSEWTSWSRGLSGQAGPVV